MMYDICVAGEIHHQYSDGIFHSPVYMHINVDNIPVPVYHDKVFNSKLAWYTLIRMISTYIDRKLQSQ